MLIDSPAPELQLSLGLVMSVVLGFTAIAAFLVRLALAAQRDRAGDRRRRADRRDGTTRSSRLRPGTPGRVRVHGEIWNAIANEPIASGDRVDRDECRRLDLNGPEGVRHTMFDLSPVLIVVFILVVYLLMSINILAEYERGVVFRLGKLLPQPKGPGVVLVFAPIDRMVRVSMRTVVMDVPPQDVITRDNVSVKVNAVVYFRVIDPRRAIVEVESYIYATSQLAQTTLRSVLGQVELDQLLSERDRLNQQLQQILDQHTDPWGIKVSSVEVKHVDLPPDMQRAMARQAEAEREKRAKIIHAAGELEASEKLSQAAVVIASEPVAITLRYLQTLTEIAAEKNSTIVFPLPIEMMHLLKQITGVEKKTVSDEGFREIQLNGKQLIFLFMAVDGRVGRDLSCSACSVGRGVRDGAATTEIASGDIGAGSASRGAVPQTTARRRRRRPAGTPPSPAPRRRQPKS